VPLLRGQVVTGWRNVTLVEHVGPDLAPADAADPDDDYTMAGWAAVVPTKPVAPNSYEAIRMTNAVYVEYQDGETEYYDLTLDPFEQNNTVSALSAAQVALFHDTISNIKSCHNATECWAAQKL
jgi:hypothetical protein